MRITYNRSKDPNEILPKWRIRLFYGTWLLAIVAVIGAVYSYHKKETGYGLLATTALVVFLVVTVLSLNLHVQRTEKVQLRQPTRNLLERTEQPIEPPSGPRQRVPIDDDGLDLHVAEPGVVHIDP